MQPIGSDEKLAMSQGGDHRREMLLEETKAHPDRRLAQLKIVRSEYLSKNTKREQL